MSGQRAASILRGGEETRVVRRLGAVSRVVASRRERRGSRPVPGHRAKSRQEARKGADGGSHARGREIRRGGERIREPTRGRARTETSPSPRRRSSARTWPPSRPALAVPLGRVPRAVASDDSPCRERRRDWNRKGDEIVSNVPFSSATGGDTRRGIRARFSPRPRSGRRRREPYMYRYDTQIPEGEGSSSSRSSERLHQLR